MKIKRKNTNKKMMVENASSRNKIKTLKILVQTHKNTDINRE